jgi:predicted nucleic acid-binding protein
MRLALDTNAIIDFLKEKPQVFDLLALIDEHDCFISVITRLELLKFPDITSEEQRRACYRRSTVSEMYISNVAHIYKKHLRMVQFLAL